MSDTTTAMIHVRVDEKLKAQATEALANMGLTMSDAVRVLLVRVVKEQKFPFALQVPNAETQAAMATARAKKGSPGRFATAEELFDALAESQP
jgi:DNA-damage-inducible protein J